jgi:hypothetical protein
LLASQPSDTVTVVGTPLGVAAPLTEGAPPQTPGDDGSHARSGIVPGEGPKSTAYVWCWSVTLTSNTSLLQPADAAIAVTAKPAIPTIRGVRAIRFMAIQSHPRHPRAFPSIQSSVDTLWER